MSYVYQKFGTPSGNFVNPVDGNGSRFTYTYVVVGESNVTSAIALVVASSPVSQLSPGGEVLVRNEYIPRVTGPDTWDIDVQYVPEDHRKARTPELAGEYRVTFDTTGGQTKITQSISTTHRLSNDPINDPAPDLKQAIGWDGKKVNGVELPSGNLSLSITAYYAPGVVDADRMKTWSRAVGKVNNAVWLGFAAREVIYDGCTGEVEVPLVSSEARVKPVPVVHKVRVSENQTSFDVGDITVPTKDGWEYLWTRYKKIESADTTNIIPDVRHVYVEKVAIDEDFDTLLGFGGP